eukprot:SAG22_NODE_219_length_14877_cov_14.334619_20_plen_110_part_00
MSHRFPSTPRSVGIWPTCQPPLEVLPGAAAEQVAPFAAQSASGATEPLSAPARCGSEPASRSNIARGTTGIAQVVTSGEKAASHVALSPRRPSGGWWPHPRSDSCRGGP